MACYQKFQISSRMLVEGKLNVLPKRNKTETLYKTYLIAVLQAHQENVPKYFQNSILTALHITHTFLTNTNFSSKQDGCNMLRIGSMIRRQREPLTRAKTDANVNRNGNDITRNSHTIFSYVTSVPFNAFRPQFFCYKIILFLASCRIITLIIY